MKTQFSKVSEYPLTTKGHVGFLDFVRREVTYNVNLLRLQAEREYSNETLTRSIQGIQWHEARKRAAALAGPLGSAVDEVLRVLHLELSLDTVEWIDEMLVPAVGAVRTAFQDLLAGKAIPASKSARTSKPVPKPRPAQDPAIPLDELETAATKSDITAFAEEHFGHRPSERTLYNWKESGALKMQRRGRLWDFSRSDLERLVRRWTSKLTKPVPKKGT